MNLELLTVNEHSSAKYPPRTAYNAKTAGTTLALAVDLTTAGEKLTKKLAEERYIGFELKDDSNSIDIARALYRKMKTDNSNTLNIAGNGIYTLSEHGCSQQFINQFIYEIVAQVHHFLPIAKIYTGGQTGADIAGAVAGFALGIPTEVTLPNGFKQRFEDNVDVDGTREKVIAQIEEGAKALPVFQVVTKKNHKPG
jgi:hypothetical protein